MEENVMNIENIVAEEATTNELPSLLESYQTPVAAPVAPVFNPETVTVAEVQKESWWGSLPTWAKVAIIAAISAGATTLVVFLYKKYVVPALAKRKAAKEAKAAEEAVNSEDAETEEVEA